MFTKYKIKLDKDGLTIMQWITPGASRVLPPLQGDNSLQKTIGQSRQANAAKLALQGSAGPGTGGGIGDSVTDGPGTGGGGMGDSVTDGPGTGGGSVTDGPGTGGGDFSGNGTGAPITIIGPNIFMCSPCQHIEKEKES